MFFRVLCKKRNTDVRFIILFKFHEIRSWHDASVEHSVAGFDASLYGRFPVIITIPFFTVKSRTLDEPEYGFRVWSGTESDHGTQGTICTGSIRRSV